MITALDTRALGEEMHRWIREMTPFRRSLTGEGVRQTLDYLARIVPGLAMTEVPSGTAVFDWIVPDEWTVRDAFIADQTGRRRVDLADHDLHVVGYSAPVDQIMTRAELDPYLHSLPEVPDAIPYATRYYERGWGFCLSQRQRDALGDGPFHVRIDSEFTKGSLTYADLLIPGETTDEVLLTSYVCHPAMANNELSGPAVLAALGRWLSAGPKRRYSYRLFLGPETIGAITYIHRHLDRLRQNVVAGFVLTCVGDDRAWSLLLSPSGTTLADRAAKAALRDRGVAYTAFDFLKRGSDERQFCSPAVNLPVCSVMRSKYGTFPEYHTSLDNIDFVTPQGLLGSFEVYQDIIEIIENNDAYVVTTACEPHLGSRGLYPNLSTRGSALEVSALTDFLAFADGSRDLIALAERIGRSVSECAGVAALLAQNGLIAPRAARGAAERAA